MVIENKKQRSRLIQLIIVFGIIAPLSPEAHEALKSNVIWFS